MQITSTCDKKARETEDISSGFQLIPLAFLMISMYSFCSWYFSIQITIRYVITAFLSSNLPTGYIRTVKLLDDLKVLPRFFEKLFLHDTVYYVCIICRLLCYWIHLYIGLTKTTIYLSDSWFSLEKGIFLLGPDLIICNYDMYWHWVGR